MSLTKESLEMMKILEWAKKYKETPDNYNFAKKQESYYSSFNNVNNIHEYGFSNLSEILTVLSNLWDNDIEKQQIVKPCAVAILKGKPKSDAVAIKKDNDGNIPDYVYVF